MKLDFNLISFSRYGTYFVISKIDNNFYIRDIRNGDDQLGNIFKICVEDLNAKQLEFDVTADETKLIIKTELGSSEIIMPSEETIQINHCGLFTIKLITECKKYDYANRLDANNVMIHMYSNKMKYMVTNLKTEVDYYAPWNRVSSEQIIIYLKAQGDTFIQSFRSNYHVDPVTFKSFDENYQQVNDEYQQYLDKKLLKVEHPYRENEYLANYITWSCVVRPSGNIKRYAMYMSNNYMTNIWSWDNLFNSIPLAKDYPNLALDQFLMFADSQMPEGNYADYMNSKYISHDFLKPPIQGIMYRDLLKENEQFFNQPAVLNEVYATLEKLAYYWCVYRTFDKYEYPFYTHGNDSGLDNSTVFETPTPTVCPDLFAYLIELLQLLVEIAAQLNTTNFRFDYQTYINKYQQLLVTYSWNDNRFVSRNLLTNEFNPDSKSVIDLLPIITTNNLPNEIAAKTYENVVNHLSEHGVPSEATDSIYYENKGYWRGPIWAPTTYLVVRGIERYGDTKLASELKEKFLNMTIKGKLAENYEAQTAEGLDDKSFTWTSSVFLQFLKEQYDS